MERKKSFRAFAFLVDVSRTSSLSQENFWNARTVVMPTGQKPHPHAPNPEPAAGFPCWPAPLLPVGTLQHRGGQGNKARSPGSHKPTSSPALTPLIQLNYVSTSKRNFPREVKFKRESTASHRTGAGAIFSRPGGGR